MRATVFTLVVASAAFAACGRANVQSSKVLPEAAAAAVDAGLARSVPSDAAPSGVDPAVTSLVGLAKFGAAPANAIARNDRGVSALAKGKVADAVRELETAVGLAPDFILARYNLACARAKSGDQAGARADLEAVFAADLRAILWRDGSSQRGSVKPSMVRVGVFDTETMRFVAVVVDDLSPSTVGGDRPGLQPLGLRRHGDRAELRVQAIRALAAIGRKARVAQGSCFLPRVAA